MQANSLLELTNWKMQQPETQDWIRYQSLTEKNAARVIGQMLRTTIFDISQFSGDPIQTVVPDIMYNNQGLLTGVCDRYHVAHFELINKVIKVFLDNEETMKANKNKKGKSYMTNILDYYGRSGEFAIRVAKLTRCTVTYVEQNPWYGYAKFRFRMHDVNMRVKTLEATPQTPRPEIEDEKFGLISALDVPLNSDKDWEDWASRRLIPYGLIACKAEMPWKKIAQLEHFGYIYQFVPTL